MNVEKLGSEILRLVADALEDGEAAPKSGSAQLWEQMKAQAKERAATYERPKFEDTSPLELGLLERARQAERRVKAANDDLVEQLEITSQLRVRLDECAVERYRLERDRQEARKAHAKVAVTLNELLTAARAVLATRTGGPAVVELRAVVERIDKS